MLDRSESQSRTTLSVPLYTVIIFLIFTNAAGGSRNEAEYVADISEASGRSNHGYRSRDNRGEAYSSEIKATKSARVIDASFHCNADCNYSKDRNIKRCVGVYRNSCKVVQLFEDSHILETVTHMSCMGSFQNETKYTDDMATIITSCIGQFIQEQTIDMYEAFQDPDFYEEGMMKFVRTNSFYNMYSCRRHFVNRRSSNMERLLEPTLLEASLDVRCDDVQNVQIQKGLCDCHKGCSNQLRGHVKKFRLASNVYQKLHFIRRATTANGEEDEEEKESHDEMAYHTERDFQKLVETDPGLAHEISSAVADSVHRDGVTTEDVPNSVLEFDSANSVHGFQRETGDDWSSQPITSWLHVSCNGAQCAFASECSGVLKANLNFGVNGIASVFCRGKWKAYEDITYVCDGALTEDEKDLNDYGTAYSKISQCDGTVAVSPLTTKIRGNMNYYGLSEVCNGGSHIRGSYILEELDHRVLGQIVDPRTVEQVICLIADKNCEQLRYLV